VNAVARKECVPEASRKPANLAAATVNGEGATILYDTGCSVPALVDKKYVKPEDYTGEVIEVQFANSARDSLPVAVIDLDSPYVKGKLKLRAWRDYHMTSYWDAVTCYPSRTQKPAHRCQ